MYNFMFSYHDGVQKIKLMVINYFYILLCL